MSSASQTPSAFLYMAIRPGGGRTLGVRQARTVPMLAHSLRAENKVLLKTWRLPAWLAQESSLSLGDQRALNEQLGQLLSRGVPLVEALEVVSQSVRARSRGRIVRMRELVASGTSFADACKTVGGFDTVTIAVYRGAERSGDLAGAAKELAVNARRRMRVQGKAATLMLYPAIVLGVSLCVAVFMMLVVVPMLAESLAKSEIPVPLYSRIVFGTALWMHDHVTLLGVGAAAALAGLLVGRAAVVAGARVLMRKLPLLRDVVVAQESARFFSVMAAMTRTGVPIGDALGVANQTISHPAMRKQLDRLRTKLIEGGLLRSLIDSADTLPVGTRRLLMASERAGDLDAAFNTLATDMAEEVDERSQRLLAVLEPGLIVVMFLIIGSLLMAVMIPMFSVAGNIK